MRYQRDVPEPSDSSASTLWARPVFAVARPVAHRRPPGGRRARSRRRRRCRRRRRRTRAERGVGPLAAAVVADEDERQRQALDQLALLALALDDVVLREPERRAQRRVDGRAAERQQRRVERPVDAPSSMPSSASDRSAASFAAAWSACRRPRRCSTHSAPTTSPSASRCGRYWTRLTPSSDAVVAMGDVDVDALAGERAARVAVAAAGPAGERVVDRAADELGRARPDERAVGGVRELHDEPAIEEGQRRVDPVDREMDQVALLGRDGRRFERRTDRSPSTVRRTASRPSARRD